VLLPHPDALALAVLAGHPGRTEAQELERARHAHLLGAALPGTVDLQARREDLVAAHLGLALHVLGDGPVPGVEALVVAELLGQLLLLGLGEVPLLAIAVELDGLGPELITPLPEQVDVDALVASALIGQYRRFPVASVRNSSSLVVPTNTEVLGTSTVTRP